MRNRNYFVRGRRDCLFLFLVILELKKFGNRWVIEHCTMVGKL